jgi:hypothetical protein
MDEQREGSGLELGTAGVSIKQVGVVLGLVFAVALAVVVGKQMSTEAMAVVVGVVCGVAAGVPTSAMLLVVLNRRERRGYEETERQVRRGDYPPVVVIQGGGQPGLATGSQAGYWPAPPPGPVVDRQFHVVGGDDLLMDDGQY